MSELEKNQTGERFAPLVIKDVLARLADRSLPPTPENFAWMYRQVMHARNLPTELQYTSEIVALRHALGAFENLLIGNAWLSNRFKALTAVAQDTGRTEVDRTEHAKQILNEIVEGKQAVMLQAARLVTDTREAISELISQVAELTDCVADGRETFERAARLTEDCQDIEDVQGALRAIARDTKKLNHTLSTSDKVLDATAEQFTSNAPYLFGPPRAMLNDTRYKASGSRGFVPAKRSSIRA